MKTGSPLQSESESESEGVLPREIDRRRFVVQVGAAVLTAGGFAGCTSNKNGEAPTGSHPAPLPSAHAERCTPPTTDVGGANHIDNPPKTSLLRNEAATYAKPLRFKGKVVGKGTCAPLSGATVDVWQADEHGEYSCIDYPCEAKILFRGAQQTDENGAFTFDTVIPGEYRDRARHIHIRVTAGGHESLDTQLFFPGEERNKTDRSFSAELLLGMSDDQREGSFEIVLRQSV